MNRCSTLFCVALLVGCGKGDGKPRPEPGGLPSVAGDDPDLTYKDILDKFKAAGYPSVGMANSMSGQLYSLKPIPDYTAADAAQSLDHGSRFGDFKTPVFTCSKEQSPKDAREAAGRHEKGSWAWGRFCFRGTEETLELVKQVLAK